MSSAEGKPSVRVLAFAGARDVVGASEVEIALDAASTAAELFAVIVRAYPGLAPFQPVVRLAINGTYASPEDPVVAGDEVALIPPVAGG